MKKVLVLLLSVSWAMNVSAQSSGAANGHQYVDLGLPSGLLWATSNVGADSPSDCGDYFAWGETSPKSSYTKGNSLTYGKILSDISGDSRYDAARANWGGHWRIPTKVEFQELRNHCVWTWTSQDDQEGYLVTSAKNGNSIFLPAGGRKDGQEHLSIGVGLFRSSTGKGDSNCYGFRFNMTGLIIIDNDNRYMGLSIRPVVGNISTSNTVTEVSELKSKLGVYNSHSYVDLGLPSGLRWAAYNIGYEEKSHDYFSWGEISTKSEYSEDTYQCNNITSPDISGDLNRDPARALWGGDWRMPTQEDFDELRNHCVWTFIKKGQDYGYLVTSIKNGNSIFLPGVGFDDSNPNPRLTSQKRRSFGYGQYWCSTSNSSSAAAALYFNQNELMLSSRKKYVGCAVRPVYNPRTPSVLGGTHNGYVWVDLGLSRKWATCNVGASAPAEPGELYSWAEIRPYIDDGEYPNIEDIGGDVRYDAARCRWGGKWRIPSADDIYELVRYCDWEWYEKGDVSGYIVKGRTGKSIFLPDTHVPYAGSELDIFTPYLYVLELNRSGFRGYNEFPVGYWSIRPVLEN